MAKSWDLARGLERFAVPVAVPRRAAAQRQRRENESEKEPEHRSDEDEKQLLHNEHEDALEDDLGELDALEEVGELEGELEGGRHEEGQGGGRGARHVVESATKFGSGPGAEGLTASSRKRRRTATLPSAAELEALRAVEYEAHCVLGEAAAAEAESSSLALESCVCAGRCDPFRPRCGHNSAGSAAAGDGPWDLAVFACDAACTCDAACPLRHVAGGLAVRVRVVYCGPGKGWGVEAAEPVPAGAFVCEYAGEVITLTEARRRWRAAPAGAPNYILCLRERRAADVDTDAEVTVIDSTETGNVARFFNHSCEPNLRVVPVRHGTGGSRPTIAFFASGDIAAGDELTFDYGTRQDSLAAAADPRPCHCGRPACRGVLPFDSTV